MGKNIHHPIESLGVVHAARGDIRVEKLEDRLQPRVPFPHKHDFHQLVSISSGQGTHQIDFQKYKIQTGQLFIIKPGQVHGWNLSVKTRGFVVEFTNESLPLDHLQSADLIGKISLVPDMVMLKDSALAWQNLCTAMVNEGAERSAARSLVLQNYLSILLVTVLRNHPVKFVAQSQSENVVENFKALVEKHYHEEHSVEFYSQKLGLTAKALTMRVQRLLGISARAVIQERVLIEARRLLAFSDLTVADVGYELGYQDGNYFVRFFREHTGTTPARFRAQA